MQKPFYLCSGFHRSGTSLVARSMLENGVHMGHRLMGASFANPRGHVEDMDMVAIHDKILADNGTDWRYCKPEKLEINSSHKQAMQHYYEMRQNSTPDYDLLGAKDPRALLFIDEWRSMAGGQFRAVLVFRDWRLSVSSLLKRHSRELLNYAVPMEDRAVDFDFWRYPDLAAMMWLSAARQMIDSAKAYPSHTLLFEQQAFIENNSAVRQAAKSCNINERIVALSGYQPHLLQSSIPASVESMTSADVATACEAALNELRKVASVAHVAKTATVKPSFIARNIYQLAGCNWPSSALVPATEFSFPSHVSWNDGLAQLKKRADSGTQINWRSVFSQSNLTPKKYEDIFSLAMALGDVQAAEIAIFRAIQIKPEPWRWMHLGDLYMAQKLFEKAKGCFEQAEKLDINNATFKARLACVALYTNNKVEGERLLTLAESIDDTKPAVKNARALFDQLFSKPDANKGITQPEGVMQQVYRHEAVVEAMTRDIAKGQHLDDLLVKTAFFRRDNHEWLKKGLSGLGPSSAMNLAHYLSEHLKKHWSEATLHTELLATPPALDTYKPALSGLPRELKIGVHLHVYYPQMLPELFDFLTLLPQNTEILVTCQRKHHSLLQSWFAHLPGVKVVTVLNKGRDIAPWLLNAAKRLSHCDVVLKLHTKATPHASHLKHWRLQLMWSLLGSEQHLSDIIRKFILTPDLGILMPDYLPAIVPDLNWGKNLPDARQLASKHDLPFQDTLGSFPAGSMFWYRPAALHHLINNDWCIGDFPEEAGQTDGTIMHAIERLLPHYARQAGYSSVFTQSC